MKRKIILVGELKSMNLGDQVICNLSQYLFERQWKECDIKVFDISCGRHTLLGRIIAKFCRMTRTNYLYKYNYWYTYRHFCKDVTDNTLVIFVGGQIFMDYFMEAILAILKVVKNKRLEVRFHSCGTGPSFSSENRKKLAVALSEAKCNYLTLRDGVDLFKAKIFDRAKFVPDIAICSNLLYGDIKLLRKKIGWGCIDIQCYNLNKENNSLSVEKYVADTSSIISNLVQQGYIVELFTNGNLSDYKVAELIKNELNVRGVQVSLALRPKKDTELVCIIKNFNYVIASRLHALILSYSFDIPCFGLSWDKKIEDFFYYIGHPDRVIDISIMSEVDWNFVIEKLQVEKLDKETKKQLQVAALTQIKDIK